MPTKVSRVSTSKRRKKPASLFPWIAGVVLLLIGAGTGAYFWTRYSLPSKGLGEIASALPPTTEVLVAFDLQPQQWLPLQQFGTPEARQILDRSLQQSPLHSLLRQKGMTFERDVQPWATMVASVLINHGGTTPATLLIATTRNQGASEEFLNRYRRASGQQYTQQTYQGVSYHQLSSPDPAEVTATLGNQYVVIATDPQALFQVIDVWKGARQPLSQNVSFRRTTELPALEKPIAQAFLQGSAALDLLKPSPKPDQPPVVVPQEPEAISVSLASTTQGLQVAVTTHLRNPVPKPIPNRRSLLTTVLPQDTFFLLSGTQLLESWRSMVKHAPANSAADTNLRQIREGIENSTQLDLEQDILSWMGGEFAIGAIPAKSGIFEKNAGFGFVVLTETTDPEKTRRFLQRLDDLAVNSEGGVLPKGVTIVPGKQGTQEITTWQVGKSIAASHGQLRNNIAFWGMGELASTLATGENLAMSGPFQQMTAALPGENGGYFYLDVAVARDLFDRRIAPENWKTETWYKETMTLLQSVQGIAATQTVLNDRASRLDFAITLSPSGKK